MNMLYDLRVGLTNYEHDLGGYEYGYDLWCMMVMNYEYDMGYEYGYELWSMVYGGYELWMWYD